MLRSAMPSKKPDHHRSVSKKTSSRKAKSSGKAKVSRTKKLSDKKKASHAKKPSTKSKVSRTKKLSAQSKTSHTKKLRSKTKGDGSSKKTKIKKQATTRNPSKKKKKLSKKVLKKKSAQKKSAIKKIVRASASSKLSSADKAYRLAQRKVAELKKKLERLNNKKKDAILIKDAEGRYYCQDENCDQPATTDMFCRYHYLASWSYFYARKNLLKDGYLSKTIQELVNVFGDAALLCIMQDCKTEETFLHTAKGMQIIEGK